MLISANGKEYPIYDCGSPVFDEERNLHGVVLVFRDQSKEKRYERELILAKEKAEESDRLKSIFLRNMSHEVRTPMNAILGFSELVNEPSFSMEEKSGFLQRITCGCQRLLHIMNDIVDISKLESRELTLVFSECRITDIISASLAEIQQCTARSGLPSKEIRVILPVEMRELRIKTDAERVQQSLVNLLLNAIKYTDQGEIEVGAAIRREELKEMVEFKVKDSGKGIPPDKLAMIFQRFRQAEEDEFHEGAGLGLSITKGLVELMGGDLRVISEEGKGSTFFFTIPFFPSIIQTETSTVPDDLILDLKGKTIIIAEDDHDSFSYLKQILASTQAEIIHAGNGEELIRVLEKRKADLILLDIRMPEKSGTDCLREIKNRNIKIKIIAQTAYAFPEEEQRFLENGCDGFLSKPMKKAELFPMIRKVMYTL